MCLEIGNNQEGLSQGRLNYELNRGCTPNVVPVPHVNAHSNFELIESFSFLPALVALLLVGPAGDERFLVAEFNHLMNHTVDCETILERLLPHQFALGALEVAQKTREVSKQVVVYAVLAEGVSTWSGCTSEEQLVTNRANEFLKRSIARPLSKFVSSFF